MPNKASYPIPDPPVLRRDNVVLEFIRECNLSSVKVV